MLDSGGWPDSGDLILRADANPLIGSGHMMRCLALAQAWSEAGGRAVFLTRCESQTILRRILDEGFSVQKVRGVHPDEEDLQTVLRLHRRLQAGGRRCIVVLDGYHLDALFQEKLFDAGVEFICIDDYGHLKRYWADWLLNQNASASSRMYAGRAPRSKFLLGPDYALLRREFRAYRGGQRLIPVRAHRLLVTMGGSDPANATEKVLEALVRIEEKGIDARILLGPDNPRRAALEGRVRSLPLAKRGYIQLITTTDDMPGMISWADLAVSAGGSTCWEMAALGLPNIIVTTAENQLENSWALARRGISISLGWYEKVRIDTISQALKRLIVDRSARVSMSQRGRKLVNGSGAPKVCAIMRALS